MEQTQLQSGGKNRLVLKDLVNIGIFAVIYFVGMFIVGMPLGFMMITYMMFPFLTALVLGIVVQFFLAKTQKPFALFIFTVLPGIAMTLIETPVTVIHALIIGLIAEYIRKIIGYNTAKGNIVSYAAMSLWLVGPFWQLFILKEQYYALTLETQGAEYAEKLFSIPIWIMPILYVTAFAGGILGGLLGEKVLKKHFAKAGLV